MRVSVFINPKAGGVDRDLIENKIREALLRCDIAISTAQTVEGLILFLQEEIKLNTDYIVVCGGDGTLNTVLQGLKKIIKEGERIPPLCVIGSGTANDFAQEIGISKKVEQAARMILEGTVKNIDLIEIEGDGEKKYMITNGGLGIPAITAERANEVRASLQDLSQRKTPLESINFLLKNSYFVIKKMKSSIYPLVLLDTLRTWDQNGWSLEIEFADTKKLRTQAPFVMVNNQPCIGNNFMTAPYTSNTDGNVNLLLVEAHDLKSQISQIAKISRGHVEEGKVNKVFEAPEFKVKTLNPQRKITFFGDGEILFKDVSTIKVKCFKQSLPIVVGP